MRPDEYTVKELMMKKTFKIRRQKIHEAPTRVAELLQVYPALKSYDHVSIHIIKMFSWYIYSYIIKYGSTLFLFLWLYNADEPALMVCG